MKKKIFIGILSTTLLFANSFTFNVFAADKTEQEIVMKLNEDTHQLVIETNTDEELDAIFQKIEENNEKVDKLWETALKERSCSNNNENQIQSKASYQDYHESANVLMIGKFVGLHGLKAKTTTENNQKRFVSYDRVYVVSDTHELLEEPDNNVQALDSYRTYSVKSNIYVTGKSRSGLERASFIKLYTEFYADGGAKNFN